MGNQGQTLAVPEIKSDQIVVFTIDLQRYALPLPVVERAVRVVEITPVPKAPEIMLGVINMQGQVIPVLNLRRMLRLPDREPGLGDQMIIAQALGLKVAVIAGNVMGVTEYWERDIVASEKIFPGIEYVEGVVKLKDGMVFIYDLDGFLCMEEKGIRECLTEAGHTAP